MRLLPVLAAPAAAIALAVPANAAPSSSDAEFVAELNKAGISYHSEQEAVAAGQEVCSLLKSGEDGGQVVQKMTQADPSFSQLGAEKFAGIAATVYCPQYMNVGGASAGGKSKS